MHITARATTLAAIALVASAAVASAAPTTRQSTAETPAASPGPAQPGPRSAAPGDPGAGYLEAFDALAGGYATDSRSGGTVGTVVGAAAGCGLGAVTGGTLTLFVSAGSLTPLGVVGGCLIGADVMGFWGSTIGGAVTGIPALATGMQHANDLLRSGRSAPAPPSVPGGSHDDVTADLHQAVVAAEQQSGLATSLGVLAGSGVGMAVGCPLGAVTGGSLTTLLTAGTLTVPVAVMGCLLGGSAVGGAGALVGGALLAVPVGVAAGVQTFNALRAAPHTASDVVPGRHSKITPRMSPQ